MSEIVKTRKAISAAEAREKKANLARKAYQMRLSGMKWWDIAENLGITEDKARTTVAERVTEVSNLIDSYQRHQFLSLELDRLDALQAGLWEDAVDGKVAAVQAVLAIMDRRAKWLGFAEPQQQTVTNNTIVVPGNSKDYVEALRQVRREIEAA